MAVTPFSFVAVLAEVSKWPYTWRLLIQFLETRLFQLVFTENCVALRARAFVETLTWENRAIKVGTLAQMVYDKGACAVPQLEYKVYSKVPLIALFPT